MGVKRILAAGLFLASVGGCTPRQHLAPTGLTPMGSHPVETSPVAGTLWEELEAEQLDFGALLPPPM